MIFSTSLLFLWDAWQREQHPPSPGTPEARVSANGPTARAQDETPVPGEGLVSTQPGKGTGSASGAAPEAETGGKLESGEKILVKTNMITAEIDTAGGG